MTAPVIDRWLTADTEVVGRHTLIVLAEVRGSRAGAMTDLRKLVTDHYVLPRTMAQRLASLGAPKTAKLLRELLPRLKKARSGDIGEILATEIAESQLGYKIPIRRLRWKDGRNMALRGDDIIGIKRGDGGGFKFLKGESKSRATLSTDVITKAAESLDRDSGRPTSHSALFVANRLRELGKESAALLFETAVLNSFRGHVVEHLLFALSGNAPKSLLSTHLTGYKKRKQRHVIAVHIVDHGAFIASLYAGM